MAESKLSAPGLSDTVDQEGETRDQEGETKNQESETRDQEGETRGQEGETKDQESETRDQEGETRGQEGKTRDQDGSHGVSHSPGVMEGLKGNLDRVAEFLNEIGILSVPELGSARSSGSSQDFVDMQSSRNQGVLRFYHRGTAVRMLKDYLSDLKTLNSMTFSVDDNLKSRVKEYETFSNELREANEREPNSSLTWQERRQLSSMLRDYQVGLSMYLEDQEDEDVPGVENVELIVDQPVADGVPLYLHEAEFSGGSYVESLTAALERCETQVQDLETELVPVVFLHQCKYFEQTLGPVAVKFKAHRFALNALQKLEIDGGGVSSNSQLRNCVHFCFESLVGLARRLQMVVDLFRKCSSGVENLHTTALELADLPPPPSMSRWSEFSLAIRNFEWSMDLVELAFYTLDKLLSGCTHIFQDVSFRWSEGKGRMVLQIQSGLGRQDSGQEKPLLDVMKELEAKDLADLGKQLEKLAADTGSSFKSRFTMFSSKADINRAEMGRFLSTKLSGPIPHARYLPWTFTMARPSLKFREYLDSGSAGMVATYSWLGRKVAGKSIRSPGLSRHKFEEEAAILATVQHPNVVRLIGYSFIDETKTGMLVMELMDHDLRTIIDQRVAELGPGSSPFSTIVAIDIILQIAQAMLHLRDHKVLHRDLKAKNILVNVYKPLNSGGASNTGLMLRPDVSTVLPHTQENYVAKLADFGLAKCRPGSSWVITRMAGTTGWRAPEVFNVPDTEVYQEYKWPADVYSFAMTCYEILTGKLPFQGYTNASIHGHVMAGDRPEGLDNLEIPDLLKDLVKRCWATNPDERPTFEEIVKSLWECRVKAIFPVFERHINPSPSGPSPSSSFLV